MFDGVSEEDDPDAALRALLARQLDWVAATMIRDPGWAAVGIIDCLSLVFRYEMRHGRPANLGAVRGRLDLLRRSLERRFGPL